MRKAGLISIFVFVLLIQLSLEGAERRNITVEQQNLIETLEIIIESLQKNPQQFKVRISVTQTGMKAVGGPGGPGAVGIAGGSGGTNIGIQASASAGSIKPEVIGNVVGGAMDEELSEAIKLLTNLKEEVKKEPPDKTFIKRIFHKIKGSVIPDVIIKIIWKLLEKGGLVAL